MNDSRNYKVKMVVSPMGNNTRTVTFQKDEKLAAATKTQESNACGLSDKSSSDACFSLDSTVDLEGIKTTGNISYLEHMRELQDELKANQMRMKEMYKFVKK